MTRVRLKNNPDMTGTVVGEKAHGGLIVRWDDEDHLWIIGRERLEFIKDDKPEEE